MLRVFGLLVAMTAAVLLFRFFLVTQRPQEPATVRLVRHNALEDIRTFQDLTGKRLLPLLEQQASEDSLQHVFLQTRRAYKRIEFLIEYFFPNTARHLNGAPLDEIETGEYEVNEPIGLQVMEGNLFPHFIAGSRAELIRQAKCTLAYARRAQTLFEEIGVTDAHIFDAMRLQMFRILTLGLSGFDAPIAQSGIAEAAESLDAMVDVLQVYQGLSPDFRWKNLLAELNAARHHLLAASDFNAFDRLAFLIRFGNPLSAALTDAAVEFGLDSLHLNRPLRPAARTLFDADAFDPDFYAPAPKHRSSPAKVALGKKLFYDPVLSEGGTRSCASCHQPEKAFTDGLPKAAALPGRGQLLRNTPTLLNAGLQAAYFYDLRSTDLEHQAKEVVENEQEMHGSFERIVSVTSSDPAYQALFRQAFGLPPHQIKEQQVQEALAAYIRSLTALDSRFDRYVRGERQLLNAEEKQGFNLFMGKAKCGTCHFMPLFNGTVPPNFTKTESEVLGTLQNPVSPAPRLDRDPGRFALHDFPQFKNAFKTPTLRNISHTAPYMHNGAYTTLEQVMEFYNNGGGSGLGLAVDNQTLDPSPLGLSDEERRAVIAFLHTLTDLQAAESTPKPDDVLTLR